MDNSLLVTVAVLAITAISSWLQKKGQTEDPDSLGDEWKNIKRQRPEHPPRMDSTSSPSRPVPGIDWEKELRRFLGGEAPSAPPPIPPPVVVQQPSRPPPLLSKSKPKSSRPVVAVEPDEGPSRILSTLTEAASAYEKAQRLHEKVAGRMRKTDKQTQTHKAAIPGHAKRVAPEIASVVSLLRSPHTARHAVVASLILSPPKALEG